MQEEQDRQKDNNTNDDDEVHQTDTFLISYPMWVWIIQVDSKSLQK